MKRLARALFPALTVAVIIAIFLLTAQDSAQSTQMTQDAVKVVENDILKPNWDSPLAPLMNWVNGLGLRRLAHVVEFLPLGVFSIASIAVWRGDWPVGRMAALAAAFCLANSVADQAHKLIVPGREFDAVDLAYDAVGYGVGVAACALVIILTRKGGRK